MDSTPTSRVYAEMQIRNLFSALAFAHDRLDFDAFAACFVPEGEMIDFDISGHLSEMSREKISASDLITKSRQALSGFTGTQHMLGNVAVDFDETDPTHARVMAMISAYHYLETKEGDEKDGAIKRDSVTSRGTWDFQVVKQPGRRGLARDMAEPEKGAMRWNVGDWKIVGLRVWRDYAAEGNMKAYDIAKERVASGHGRPDQRNMILY